MFWLALTTLEKIHQVPMRFWTNVGLALLVFFAAVLIARHAARMNRIVLWIIVLTVAFVVGLQWIYERNEPEFLRPYIDKVAPFFPSKVDYAQKQKS